MNNICPDCGGYIGTANIIWSNSVPPIRFCPGHPAKDEQHHKEWAMSREVGPELMSAPNGLNIHVEFDGKKIAEYLDVKILETLKGRQRKDLIALEELRPGAIFVTREGTYAVKSEYLYPNGQCECVLLASGEYAHFPDGNATLVREVRLIDGEEVPGD